MKRIVAIVSIVAGVFFVSCSNQDVAYEKTYTIENNLVLGSNPLVFEFNNEADTFQLYDITISICHKPKITYVQLPITLGYTSPRGESVEFPALSIPLYDTKYNYIGEVQPDSSVLLKNMILTKNSMLPGKNVFTITPATFNDTLVGVSAISLTITRAN